MDRQYRFTVEERRVSPDVVTFSSPGWRIRDWQIIDGAFCLNGHVLFLVCWEEDRP